MKLFIWQGDGVLSEYSDGMICALARDLPEALEAIRAAGVFSKDSFPNDRPSEVVELNGKRQPARAWFVWGGE